MTDKRKEVSPIVETPEEKLERIKRDRERFLNPDPNLRPYFGRIVYDDSPGEASGREL